MAVVDPEHRRCRLRQRLLGRSRDVEGEGIGGDYGGGGGGGCFGRAVGGDSDDEGDGEQDKEAMAASECARWRGRAARTLVLG